MIDENTELSMIDCGVRSLRDVSLHPGLASINLHSNLLSRIENLTFMQNLIHLDLSSNQIKRIDGLHALVSLRTLNLSCNSIVSIESLGGLRTLTWLNLSYNKINSVHGLGDVWGGEYSLETLLLHNNFISSLEELTYYLSGLKHLKHLTLCENKFVKLFDYHSAVFASVKFLHSLDHQDKSKKPVQTEAVKKNSARLGDFYNMSIDEAEKKKSRRVLNDSVEDVSKLELIEAKIHQLLSIRDTFKESESSSNNNSNSSTMSNSRSSSDESVQSSPTWRIKQQQPAAKKGILKNTISEESTAWSSKTLAELVELTKTQLESHREAQEANAKLVAELRANIESLREEKQTSMQKNEEKLKAKDEELRKLKEANEVLSKEVENLHKAFEASKVEQTKPNNEQIKVRLKKWYETELSKAAELHIIEQQKSSEKIVSLEKSYKSLEDEFRAALMIEAGRYSELFGKYDAALKECTEMRSAARLTEEKEARDKALIKELNDLIREQKERLQTMSKLKKESSEEVKKRSEKLGEAVSDCVKLKAQLETMRKERKELEAQMKKVALQFNQMSKEKESWDTKMAEQKSFLMQENSQLSIENKTMACELDLLRKNLDAELDNVRIKTKMIEDQTETVRKLKSALVERDEMLKKSRDEALSMQKSLEKQLSEEMDVSNELQVKLEKANEKKEVLKAELDEAKKSGEETQRAYEELAEKWRQKSELISELDGKVRKMKENFEAKEKALETERDAALEKSKELSERVLRIDNEFRKQYDVEKREHLRILEKTRGDYEKKLRKADSRMTEIEDEMRQVLTESANTKKLYEEKLKSLSAAFAKIQVDF